MIAPRIREMHASGISLMRIAATFDLRVSVVRAVIEGAPAVVPRKDWGRHIDNEQRKQSVALQQSRKGKRRPVAEVQAATIGRRRAVVSLPSISLLETKP